MDITNTIVTILALVIVFLFAIQKFSRHIEDDAGDHLKTLLNNWTRTPLRGVGAGTVLTAILQSSTAATIISVGLVNSKIIPFFNALGLIIGINIGTIITSQLIALKMTYLAPLVVIIGFIISHTHSRFRKFGKTVFYFGVMFLALLMISYIVDPLTNDPTFISLIENSGSIYGAILIGALATAIFQSSSVFMGLVIILASSGILGLDQVIGFILGAAIGGPTIALFASMSADHEAKKVAMAHSLFNLIGVAIFLPLAYPFEILLRFITEDATQQIVNAQFIFNITAAIICFTFLRYFSKSVSFATKKIM